MIDKNLIRKLNEAGPAERRGIYEYVNASGTYHGICIVIAAEHRKWDKYVSVITLTAANTDLSNHDDKCRLLLPDGTEWNCHCGMITYIRRDRIGKMIGKVSNDTMNYINDGIRQELGLFTENKPDYEKMYKDLLAAVVEGKTPAKKRAIKKGEGGTE